MSVLSEESHKARTLLEQLRRASVIATSTSKLGGRTHTINTLIRTGLAKLDEKPGHVVLRITDDGRKEIESWMR